MSAARSTPLRGRTELIGRENEMALLAGLVEDLPQTGCRFLLLGGDAGMGKTSVVDAAASAAAGMLAVRGHCIPLGGEGLPYAPVAGALHDLDAAIGTERLLEWAGGGRQALGAVVPDLIAPDPGSDDQLRLFEAIARLLTQVAATQPLMIIVEDLHWADESTRQLLLFLPGALRDAPVLIIGTYRPDEIGRRHPLRSLLGEAGRLPQTSRLDLAPLEQAATTALVSAVLGRAPSTAVVAAVHQRSGGIPFYIEELASWTGAGSSMPSTVRDAVLVRLAQLSESSHDVVRIAAVLGDRVPHEALVAIAADTEEDLETHLREAVDVGVLLVDGDAYAFRHALLREAVEEELLPGERSRLHRQAAATLEAQPELLGQDVAPYAIALHWAAGRDHEKAFAWSVRAARSRTAAHFESLRMYERVLELWSLVVDPTATAGPYAALLEDAARTAKDAGDYERALGLATEALAETGADEVEGRFTRLMLRLHLLIDLIRPGAEQDAAEAATLLDRLADGRARAHALEQLAAFYLNSGGDGSAVARSAVAAAVATGDHLLEATARNTHGILLMGVGEEAEGLRELARAGDLLGATEDRVTDKQDSVEQRAVVRYHVNFSDALQSNGQYEDALTQAAAGIRTARAYGIERDFGSLVAGNAAEAMMSVGRFDEAVELIQEALRLDPPRMSVIHLELSSAWIALWRGDLAAAESALAPLRTLITDVQPMPQTVAQTVRIDAELAMFTGRPERAWSHVLFFLDHRRLYDPVRSAAILAVGAAAAAELERRAPAGRGSTIRHAVADLRPTRMLSVWRPVLEAELADDADGWARAADSLEANQAAPAHLRPYAQLRWARHLADARERTQARAVIADAFARADDLGLGLLTARLAPLATQVGGSVSAARGAGRLAGLTSREIEVLRLVASGRSNAEIGRALFISAKTASVHVSNILAKLSVGGRVEAAAIAHREGL